MLAVCDYGIGNLRSAEKAFQRLVASARLVADPEVVAQASGVVVPGVGRFGPCARALRQSGLAEAARHAIAAGTPFLGICIGFQLLYEGSEESPGEEGLGVLPGVVKALPASVKRPHMRWNHVRLVGPSALLGSLDAAPWFYFVHSYAAPLGPETVAVCDYGGVVPAAAETANVWGVQFHPEKSSRLGLEVLAAFVARCGERPA